jgi:hypothetical protein
MRYVLTLEQYATVLKNESLVGDTIVCDKCKWSWAKDDAGKDPLTCHKCGHTNELNEKKSPYDRETLLMYKDEYEKGKEIPFGVKTSLIAQGMIAREGGEDEGKKVKSPEYSSEDHEMQHYSGVWEKKNGSIVDYSNSKNKILVGLKSNLLRDMLDRYDYEEDGDSVYFFDNKGNHFATLFDRGTRYQELKHNGTLSEYGWIKEKHEFLHTTGVWEKEKIEDDGEGKKSETPKGKKVKGEYLTADTKKERELMKKEIDKHSKKDPDDPSSYKDWPADYKGGDTKGEPHDTKESPATKAYKKKYGDKKDESVVNEDSKIETALKNKSDETGIPYGILKQVHDRGMAAWRTGHKPGTPQAAWAMGRVNSFITGEGGARKADSDLWDDYKKKK